MYSYSKVFSCDYAHQEFHIKFGHKMTPESFAKKRASYADAFDGACFVTDVCEYAVREYRSEHCKFGYDRDARDLPYMYVHLSSMDSDANALLVGRIVDDINDESHRWNRVAIPKLQTMIWQACKRSPRFLARAVIECQSHAGREVTELAVDVLLSVKV